LFDCGIAKFSLNNEFTLVQGIDEHIIENECCAKNYIKGVFATASTSNIILDEGNQDESRTFSGYHWEFVFTSEAFADDFSNLLFAQGIPNKKSKRKNLYVLYIKEAEVVRTGNYITSRSAGTAIPFGLKIIEAIKGIEEANRIQQVIYYNVKM
jgi:hypothetical protein